MELLGEKPIPVPLCPQQIPHGMPWDRTRAPARETGDKSLSDESVWHVFESCVENFGGEIRQR